MFFFFLLAENVTFKALYVWKLDQMFLSVDTPSGNSRGLVRCRVSIEIAGLARHTHVHLGVRGPAWHLFTGKVYF